MLKWLADHFSTNVLAMIGHLSVLSEIVIIHTGNTKKSCVHSLKLHTVYTQNVECHKMLVLSAYMIDYCIRVILFRGS